MKKHIKYSALQILASALMAAAATGCCSQAEPDLILPVGFSAGFGEISRATTQEPLDGNKYAVWASAVYKSIDTSSSFYSPNHYFNSNTLKLDYSASSNSYIATNYFYPLSGNMQFAAYATNMATEPSASFTFDANKKATKLTVDLSSSDGLREVIYSDLTSVSCPVNDSPLIWFHRAQANLRFKFIPADELTCKHVIINSIEIKSLRWKGKFDVTYDTQGKAIHTWRTPLTTPADYTYTFVASGTVPAEDSELRMRWVEGRAVPLENGDGVHILPKTDGRSQIIIRYTVLNDPTSTSQGGVGGDVPESLLGSTDNYRRQLIYVIDAEPTKNWLDGTQYYYNITVHGNSQMDVERVSVAPIMEGTTGTMKI